jgi:hypothetical protein
MGSKDEASSQWPSQTMYQQTESAMLEVEKLVGGRKPHVYT